MHASCSAECRTMSTANRHPRGLRGPGEGVRSFIDSPPAGYVEAPRCRTSQTSSPAAGAPAVGFGGSCLCFSCNQILLLHVNQHHQSKGDFLARNEFLIPSNGSGTRCISCSSSLLHSLHSVVEEGCLGRGSAAWHHMGVSVVPRALLSHLAAW